MLQLDHFEVRKIFLKIQQVGNLRAAPAVNALVIIAHHAHIAMLSCQHSHQLKLCRVGVLIFIDHHVLVSGSAFLQCFGVFIKQLQRQHQQIIKIHRVGRLQRSVIALANMIRHRKGVFVTENVPVGPSVLEAAEQTMQFARICLHILARDGAENFLHHTQLLTLIVNHEVALVAELFNVPPQDTHAKRVKGANRRLKRLAVIALGRIWDELGGALLHFARGLVGKGNRQNVPRRDALIDHVRHAISDCPGLARACTRQDEQRPVNGLGSLALFGVQSIQIGHEWTELNGGQ